MIYSSRKLSGVTLVIQPKPIEPKESRIALKVCACHKPESLILFLKQTERIVSLLGITVIQLGYFILSAVLTHSLVVVACYKQRDIAEEKLARLREQTPFIGNSCHSFELLIDE